MIFAFGTHFERISATTTIVLSVLALLTIVFDLVAPILGAGKYKASKWGIIGATLGSFLGIFIFGLWGIILGPFLGATLGEILTGRGRIQALKVGLGTIFGLIIGTVLRVAVIFVMLGFLISSWF
jgi:uncharacterized protein YqgC (DUF456 family)